MSSSYLPKELYFGDDGRCRLVDGIRKMSSAVKSTLGPSGNTVLIESPHHTHGITVTKDGVTVAKAVELSDPVENLAVRMMKEAADRTALSAGDGTTTSIVLTEAMVLGGVDLIGGLNRTEVLRSMSELGDVVVDSLVLGSSKVSSRMLVDVATISSNNDKLIGKMISDVYKGVGRNGVVTVERSQTTETYFEVTRGMQFKRGYSSHMFITDHKKDECSMEDVMVLVSDIEISNILQIENILKPVISEGKRLLIISNCSVNVLNTLAANVVKGNLKCCVVQPPSFGYRQNELMQDIALSLGATYFSEKTGDDLSLINYGDLGHASKVIVSRDSTVIIRSNARSKQDKIDERIKQLKGAQAITKKKSDKDFLNERIASLAGGVGVIYVGGNTDLEQKELLDRIDDAVCAVSSALEEGIVPGAGIALANVNLDQYDAKTPEAKVAVEIMRKALKEPRNQILKNAGLDPSDYYVDSPELMSTPVGMGYNLKTMEYGNMVDMGIVDPLKVTRSALQNAISVATTILSTNAIVTMARSFEIMSTKESNQKYEIRDIR